MDEILNRIPWIFGFTLPLVAGILLGAFFFAGLWWTVRNNLFLRRPGFWFVCSLLLRMSMVMTGFYFLLNLPGNKWETLAAGLLGFILARLVAIRLVSPVELPLEKSF